MSGKALETFKVDRQQHLRIVHPDLEPRRATSESPPSTEGCALTRHTLDVHGCPT